MKLKKEIYTIFLSVLIFVCPKEVLAWQTQKVSDEPLKIGLLISDSTEAEAKRGAELAIKRVNEKGGIHGRPVQLLTRSMEGSWGVGSKEVVDLVFKEKVYAILGSHDGRNAHLVEQVIAKTRVVFLSAWASDPTLSQAYVPWYFSAVPNDNQQAKILTKEIYDHRRIDQVIVVMDRSYDAKMAWKSLKNEISLKGSEMPQPFFYDKTDKDVEHIISEIKNNETKAIIVLGEPSQAWAFIDQMRLHSTGQTVYGNLSVLGEGVFLKRKIQDYHSIVLVGSEKWLSNKPLSFQNEYYAAYHQIPGAAAAYAYDGMKVLIKALKTANLDREKMREAMLKTQVEGCTGILSFNERGVLKNDPELIEIKEGKPVLLNQ